MFFHLFKCVYCCCPKEKLGQVGVSSNIAPNHSSSIWEVISGHYWPQFILKFDHVWNSVKLEVVLELLKITHLVIIGPNSHHKLTIIEIR